jgi:PRC-barrel domain
MSIRILMATVAAIALAVPAAAQNQEQPLETEQQLEQKPGTLPEQAGESAEPAAKDEQPPVTTEAQPAEDAAEQELVEEEQAPPADMEFIEVQEEAQFLAENEVIGKDVVNIKDEEVGTITDLVMDQEQKLVGVVLSVGGFLGIADKWVAIPVDQSDFPTDEEPARLRVAVTEEQLKNAPDFTTRAAVEAEAEAERAQETMQQQQQIPSPATTNQ